MSLLVVKVGGAFLDNASISRAFFKALSLVKTQHQVVLVHGGGSSVERLLEDLQLKSAKIDGLRITPKSQINYVVGALAGTVNKQLCAQAKQSGINTVGLSLFDGNMTQTTKINQQLGCVGLATCADKTLLTTLLDGGYLPIISSIGANQEGELLNVNADQAAVVIAKLLTAPLALLCDVAGVLNQDKMVIPQLTGQQIDELIDAGIIRDGMTVKVLAALDAANAIGQPVTIAGWRSTELLQGLNSDATTQCGTTILPDTQMLID